MTAQYLFIKGAVLLAYFILETANITIIEFKLEVLIYIPSLMYWMNLYMYSLECSFSDMHCSTLVYQGELVIIPSSGLTLHFHFTHRVNVLVTTVPQDLDNDSLSGRDQKESWKRLRTSGDEGLQRTLNLHLVIILIQKL